MHPLGQKGMLRVKQTLECLQLSSFNGQPSIPVCCLVEWKKNMISKDSKFFNFISLTFIGPTYIAKIGACIIIETETPHLP